MLPDDKEPADPDEEIAADDPATEEIRMRVYKRGEYSYWDHVENNARRPATPPVGSEEPR